MQVIPQEDEEEIVLQLPKPKKRKAEVPRTLIERAHARIAENERRRRARGEQAERGCHHCKAVRSALLHCTTPPEEASGECMRKFCLACVEKYERGPVASEVDGWRCLVCRGLCRCERCEVGAAAARRKKKSGGGGGRNRKRERERKEMKKRRTSDYDICKVVYNGAPIESVPRIATISAKEIVIPTWRASDSPKTAPPAATPPSKNRKRGAPAKSRPVAEESDEEELTSDEAFEERHARAADRMRNELYPGKDPTHTRV